MHLKAIKQILIEAGIGQEPGEEGGLPEVHLYQSPEPTAKPTILILDEFNGVQVNEDLPGYYRTSPQVVVAATRFQAGHDLAQKIFRELKVSSLKVEGLTIKELRPKHMPVNYRKSEGKVVEFSTNFFYVFVNE